MYLGVENGIPFSIFNDSTVQIKQVFTDNVQERNFSCTFELLSGLKDLPSSSIILGLNWKSLKFESLQRPGVDAEAILHINFVNGELDKETHESTQTLWNTINDLERFDHAYKNGGRFTNANSETCKSERILSFLDSYSKNEIRDDRNEVTQSSRPDYDFTDYFWEFIQGKKRAGHLYRYKLQR